MAVAQDIRVARKRMKMSQAQFAEALGVSQGSVSKWEAGREVPRYETVEKIVALTGVRIAGVSPAIHEETSDRPTVVQRVTRAPLVGTFSEITGRVERYEEPDQMWLVLPSFKDWPDGTLEAWGMRSVYPDIARQAVGVFATLAPGERVDDFPRLERFLVEIDRGGRGPRLHLMELLDGGQTGFSLWPVEHFARGRLMPLPVDEDGQIATERARVIGVLIAVYSAVGRVDPELVGPAPFD